MRCGVCGRALPSGPITRELLGQAFGFCSGRCAAEFDKMFPGMDAHDGPPTSGVPLKTGAPA